MDREFIFKVVNTFSDSEYYFYWELDHQMIYYFPCLDFDETLLTETPQFVLPLTGNSEIQIFFNKKFQNKINCISVKLKIICDSISMNDSIIGMNIDIDIGEDDEKKTMHNFFSMEIPFSKFLKINKYPELFLGRANSHNRYDIKNYFVFFCNNEKKSLSKIAGLLKFGNIILLETFKE